MPRKIGVMTGLSNLLIAHAAAPSWRLPTARSAQSQSAAWLVRHSSTAGRRSGANKVQKVEQEAKKIEQLSLEIEESAINGGKAQLQSAVKVPQSRSGAAPRGCRPRTTSRCRVQSRGRSTATAATARRRGTRACRRRLARQSDARGRSRRRQESRGASGSGSTVACPAGRREQASPCTWLLELAGDGAWILPRPGAWVRLLLLCVICLGPLRGNLCRLEPEAAHGWRVTWPFRAVALAGHHTRAALHVRCAHFSGRSHITARVKKVADRGVRVAAVDKRNKLRHNHEQARYHLGLLRLKRTKQSTKGGPRQRCAEAKH
eukprot:3223222-Pleurochrysis_carterae.AAC.5